MNYAPCITPGLLDWHKRPEKAEIIKTHLSFFRYVYCGGFWVGPKEALLKLRQYHEEVVNEVLDLGLWHYEEVMLTLVFEKHPEIVDQYYGDYYAIILNYREPHSYIHIVIANLENCIKWGYHDKAGKIVAWLSPYFQKRRAQNLYEEWLDGKYNRCSTLAGH